MIQKIVGFDKDEEGDHIAILSCGHARHVRHIPPWFNRPWVEEVNTRQQFVGREMDCKKCERDN